VIRKTGTVGTAMAIYGLGKEVPEGFDVYHLADQNMVNLAFSPKIDPVITTVHDLVYLKLAGNIVEEMVSKALFYGTKKSDQIISISESTSQDIQNHLSIPSLKVNTVYNGVSREFSPATEERVTRFANKHGLSESSHYIVHMGNNNERKDIPTLLKVLRKVRDSLDSDVKLLRPRGLGEHSDLSKVLGVEDSVIDLGFIEESEICDLYTLSDVFISTSTYEGFGLPPLEAMSCGTPVVATQVASVPEVVGDAGRLHPPGDVEGFAQSVCEILTNPEISQNLREKGTKRAKLFSWEKCAAELDSIYASIAKTTTE
jgi:Glycosyltransferase